MIRKSILQMIGLMILGAGVGLAYNAVSPQGIPLTGGKEARLEQQGAQIVSLKEVEYYLKQPGIVLVDARSPEEYSLGHIPKALNLPDDQFDKYIGQLRNKLMNANFIIVYCSGGSCGTSEDLAGKLLKIGIGDSRIAVFEGGLPVWMRAKLPIERSKNN